MMTRERKIKDKGFTPLEKATDRKRNSLTGFTLLEIMVVVGLLTFIMSAVFGILASARRVWATGEALISLQQEGSLGLDKMVRELRLCSFATVGSNPNSVRFNIPIDANRDGFIDLSIDNTIIYGVDDPDDSINPNGLYGEEGWWIEYQIDTVNKQIIRRVLNNANPPEEVTRRIVVKNINPDPLRTYFQTEPAGGTSTDKAVNIGLAIEIGAMEGLTLNPTLKIALRTQVNLRN